MALKTCRECRKEVSSSAKKCPHCGISRPYRKTWKDMPKWQRIFLSFVGIFIILPFVLMMVATAYKGESILYKEVQSLPENQHQKKYEGYLKLHNKNNTKKEYIEKTIKYGRLYLKAIPSTNPDKNLQVYTALSKLDKNSNYSSKIKLYSFMVSVSTDCAITAENMSKKTLTHQSTYDSKLLGTFGKWQDKNNYVYQHSFEGKNSFGVIAQFAAQYVCNVNADTKKYSVNRISINQQ